MHPQKHKKPPAKMSGCLSNGDGLLDDIFSFCCLAFTMFYPPKFFNV